MSFLIGLLIGFFVGFVIGAVWTISGEDDKYDGTDYRGG